MTERKYLPTIADLIDRLSITLMKSIFIDRDAYRAEMDLIMTDLQLVHWNVTPVGFVRLVHMIQVNMLANRYIWENEGAVRQGEELIKEHREMELPVTLNQLEIYTRLRATHSINGIRNRAKNEINKIFGERQDQKVDCLAADLPKEFGNWNIFDPS